MKVGPKLEPTDEWLLIDDIVNEQCIKQQQYASTLERI
jgi:hypothetical protein